jgi:acyl-CoA reductase-like NAD-dependent aldehyde dehydrogenase
VVELARELRHGASLLPGAASSPRGAASSRREVDVGAMVTGPQLAVVERLVHDALDKGARVLVPDTRPSASRSAGQFFPPTVLADVTPDMAIMQEETFGPVMVLCRVWNEDEAVRRANDTQFGLGSTVLTKDRRRAKRIQRQIVAGNTCVNDFGLTYMAMDLPFGGTKASGFGRLNGREGLRACTNTKSVLYDRLPFHAPAKVYPVRAHHYPVAREALRLLYGRGLRRKIAGAIDLAAALVKRGDKR